MDNKDLIMKSYITQLHGLSDGRQTLMQNMVAKIAQEVDIQPLSLYYFPAEQESDAQLNSRLDGIIGGVRANDTVIIQTPTLMSLNYSTMLFKKLVALRQLINSKLIAFVENIFAQEKEVIEQCVSFYNNCDALIVSSRLAVDKLKGYGVTNNKIILFDYFDYEPTLDISKSSVLKKAINYISDEQLSDHLNVFRQAGYAVNKFSKQDIENDLLVNEINQNGGFGLIWSDVRESNEYYSLANPIELGIFISAGMPVIAKKKYFCSKFIEEKNLGFTVDNLDEAIAKLELLTENDYRSMVKEVEKATLITRNGISIKKALIDAIFQANLPKID